MSAAVELPRLGRRRGDVVVMRDHGGRAAPGTAQTPTFTVRRSGSLTIITHRLAADAIDNDLAARIADELVRPGLVAGSEAFERCFAGVVESFGPTPVSAWQRFYRNTLTALDRPGVGAPDGPIAAFRAIYQHAAALVAGDSVLDTGSCFGFFPLRLAAAGHDVIASDRDPNMVRLLAGIARSEGIALGACVADVTTELPFQAHSIDTVTALHLIEHLPERVTAAVLARLCAVARRRVIIAVPFESVPDSAFGHIQSFDIARLAVIAAGLGGWTVDLHAYHGGWLVLDRRRT